MPRKTEIKGVFYICHVANLRSILDSGILSHALVEAQQIPFTPVYDAAIISV